jgi:hypothetical protein
MAQSFSGICRLRDSRTLSYGSPHATFSGRQAEAGAQGVAVATADEAVAPARTKTRRTD